MKGEMEGWRDGGEGKKEERWGYRRRKKYRNQKKSDPVEGKKQRQHF